MTEEKRSFWDRLFDVPDYSGREEKVIEYIIHRLDEGAHLDDIVQEEYVRRHVSPQEAREICSNPRLVHSARERLEKTFGSGELDPDGPR